MLPKTEAERKQCILLKQLLVVGSRVAAMPSATLTALLHGKVVMCGLLESVRTILYYCSLDKPWEIEAGGRIRTPRPA